MYIYSKSAKIAFFELYPMGILWECYGYPMVRSGSWQVFVRLLLGCYWVIVRTKSIVKSNKIIKNGG